MTVLMDSFLQCEARMKEEVILYLFLYETACQILWHQTQNIHL